MNDRKARAYYEMSEAAWAAIKARLDAAGDDARVLFRGATLITMDPGIGDFDEGDFLVRGRRIEAVGRDLSAVAEDGGAIVVPAGGMIIAPGLWSSASLAALPFRNSPASTPSPSAAKAPAWSAILSPTTSKSLMRA